MKKNKKALSLIIALLLSLIMIIIALYILNYMFFFMKSTKGIENSVRAYYFADSGIEDALYFMSTANLGDTKTKNIFDKKGDYAIEMIASGMILPPIGEGNSEFDKDYNIIRTGKPIQIEVGNDIISPLSQFKLFFRVPDFNKDGSSDDGTLSGATLKIINWQLIGENNILNASGSQITADQINGDLKTGKAIFVSSNKNGRTLFDSEETFYTFYNNNCGSGKSCILKMSVINKLELTNGNKIPYLEWKMKNSNDMPLRYTIIKTKGRSIDFEKSLDVKIPQQTVNEAYDFTVFQ